MNILVLGGQSESNIEWLNDISEALPPSSTVTVHSYEFWSTEVSGQTDKQIIENELNSVLSMYSSKQFDVVIAKSLGCYFALELAKTNNVKRLVLIGLPCVGMSKLGVDIIAKVNSGSTKVTVINNESDPQLGTVDLKKALVQNSRLSLIINEASDTHKYPVDESFTKQLTETLNT